jgi:hypothetical protein
LKLTGKNDVGKADFSEHLTHYQTSPHGSDVIREKERLDIYGVKVREFKN